MTSIAEVNQISFKYHYPFVVYKNLTHTNQDFFVTKADQSRKLHELLVESKSYEYVIVNIFINLQLFRLYINEYLPLIRFSLWRNKIS